MLKEYIAGCFMVASVCSIWAAEPSPFALNEAELWQKILDRNKPGSTINNFTYIAGVPNISLTEMTTPQATALANILCYLSSRTNNALCCFSDSKEDKNYLARIATEVGWPITNALSENIGFLLMEQIEKRHSKMEEEELVVGKDLCVLEEAYKKKKKEWMVILSGGVSHSALVGRYIGAAKDINDIKKRLLRFAEKKDYRLDVQIKENPATLFFSDQLSSGIPILLVIGGKRFSTVVGGFTENNNNFLIMHDPYSAEQQFNRTDFGGLCMRDCKGKLTDKMQPGVHLYQLGVNKENLSTLAITQWTRDDEKLREILRKEVRRIKK